VGISVRAELRAITAGLEIAWSRGITKLIIEWDSELVIDCITKESIKMDANYILIVKARELTIKKRLGSGSATCIQGS